MLQTKTIVRQTALSAALMCVAVGLSLMAARPSYAQWQMTVGWTPSGPFNGGPPQRVTQSSSGSGAVAIGSISNTGAVNTASITTIADLIVVQQLPTAINQSASASWQANGSYPLSLQWVGLGQPTSGYAIQITTISQGTVSAKTLNGSTISVAAKSNNDTYSVSLPASANSTRVDLPTSSTQTTAESYGTYTSLYSHIGSGIIAAWQFNSSNKPIGWSGTYGGSTIQTSTFTVTAASVQRGNWGPAYDGSIVGMTSVSASGTGSASAGAGSTSNVTLL